MTSPPWRIPRKKPVVVERGAGSLQDIQRERQIAKRRFLELTSMASKNLENSSTIPPNNTEVELAQDEDPETQNNTTPAQNDANVTLDEPSATGVASQHQVQEPTGGYFIPPSEMQAALAPAQDPIDESSTPGNSESVHLNRRDQKTAQEVQASFLLAQHDPKNIDEGLGKVYSAVGTTETMRLEEHSLETDFPAELDASLTTSTISTPADTTQASNRELQPSTLLSASLAENSLTRSSGSTLPRWTSRVGHLLVGPIGYLQHAMEHLYKALSVQSEATGKETISLSRVSTILLVVGLLPSFVLLLIPALMLAALLVLSCFPVVGLAGIVFALQKLQQQLDHSSPTAPANPCSTAETQANGEASKSALNAEIRNTEASQPQCSSPRITGGQGPQQAEQKWGRLQDFGATCVHYLKCRTQFDVLFFIDVQGSLRPKWAPYIALMLLGATPLLCLSAIPLAVGLLLLVLILVPVLIAVPIFLLLALPFLAFFTFCASLPVLLYLPWASLRARMREAIHHAASSTKGLCKLD